MPKRDPPVRLRPALYEEWLLENPKPIDGGPIELEDDPEIDDQSAITLPSRHVNSLILPEEYTDITIIMSEFDEFDGIKYYVTPAGFDYLIRADQTHHNGTFKTVEGDVYGNYPHFHEINYYETSLNGRKPGTRRRVTIDLYENITPEDLLEAFMLKYYLDDGREIPIQSPIRRGRQKELGEFGDR